MKDEIYWKVIDEAIDLNADNKIEVSRKTIDKLNDKPKVSKR